MVKKQSVIVHIKLNTKNKHLKKQALTFFVWLWITEFNNSACKSKCF